MDSLVAISVSDPPAGELEARGLLDVHVRHAFVELVRQILAAGGSIAYGGDLRQSGYTETLMALLRTYSRPDRPPRARVRQYLADYLWNRLDSAAKAQLAVAMPVHVPSGAVDGDSAAVVPAADLTAMRQTMTDQCSARIVLGGRVDGQTGPWPGIVEEAWLAARSHRPLFVIGGFGGAAELVASAVRGRWPPELSTEHQVTAAVDPEVRGQLVDGARWPDEQALRDVLAGAELHNGLDADDNEWLMGTSDVDLIVALILRGLRALELVTVPS